MSKPKQRREHRAVFEHETGRFRLMTDYEWIVGKDLAPEIIKVLEENPAKKTVNPDTNDWEPYVKKIAKLTGAKVVDLVPYPDYPPDTIF